MDWSRAHRIPIQLRYSDTDMMGHINNAAYAQFLEIARLDFLDTLLGQARPGGAREEFTVVLARLELNYRREVRLGQAVEVLTRLVRVGRSSWTYSFQLLADGVLSADGESVQVHIDPDSRRPAPLPQELREAMEAALQGVPGDLSHA